MKVVLFCGGMGMRLRPLSPEPPGQWASVTSDVSKPMVRIGGRMPLMWHVMKYYAHFGHRDFVLCLGYQAEAIKDFFLNYNECLNNDFVLSAGGGKIDLLGDDIHDWNIAFVDTGLYACVGERLKAVESYLEGEEAFLANYSDGLTDLPLTPYVDNFLATDKVGAFVCVRPPHTTHVVKVGEAGVVQGIDPISGADVWINGGYFVFRRGIFDYMRAGEELVAEPFQRLIAEQKLLAHKYTGFWTCIDTFKEKQELDEMCARGEAPWRVWEGRKDQPAAG